MKSLIISTLLFLIITLCTTFTVFAQTASIQDQQACEYARKNNNAEIWQDYLKQFPNGMCAFEARSEIRKFVLDSSREESKRQSLVEKKIEMIKDGNRNRPVKQMVEFLKIEGDDSGVTLNSIMDIYFKIREKTTPYEFAELSVSPNRNIKISKDISQVHIKNDYISNGNVMVFLMQGNRPAIITDLKFNAEKRYPVSPGYYDFIIIVDRPDNSNVYVFKSSRFLQGGETYVGEFKIIEKYNKTVCPKGYIRDDRETCIAPSLKIINNCDPGTHLVEHLCCEEGFNFIMEGQCSRYSDTDENIICPSGYHEAGKGRCCPTGMLFIGNKCQVPK